MTTTELLTEWMTNEQQERIKAQTYARYMGLIELHIVPAIGERDIGILTRRQIETHPLMICAPKVSNFWGAYQMQSAA